MDLVLGIITHEDDALGIHCDSPRFAKNTSAPERTNKSPVVFEYLYSVVATVRHINPVGGVERNSLGGGYLANTGS